VILNFLEDTGQQKSMHGRLLQGIAFFQDILNIIALSVLYALKRTLVFPAAFAASNATVTDPNSTQLMSSYNNTSYNINYSQLPDALTYSSHLSTEVITGLFGRISSLLYLSAELLPVARCPHILHPNQHCNTLQHTLQQTATHTATHCNTHSSQISTEVFGVCCSVCRSVSHSWDSREDSATHCDTHCNTHCNTLHHTLQHTGVGCGPTPAKLAP